MNREEIKKMLEHEGINSDGNIDSMQRRAIEAGLPVSKLVMKKIIPSYVGKAKGTAQVACERGLLSLDGKLLDGSKGTHRGENVKDALTGMKTLDPSTSIVALLEMC